MDRYIESLLPQDLLLEMDADDQNRMNKCVSRTSLGSRSIDSSLDLDIGDYLPIYGNQTRKEVIQSEDSKWETKILPLCIQFIRTYISNSIGSPIENFLVNEAKIQCKFRQLNIGDGFPSDEIIQDYSISQINGINAISEIIDNYIGVEPPRRIQINQIPQVKKPILQSADYSGNALEKIQTRLPLFAPSCSPATEKITVYLKRSYQCAKDIAQMRKLLENFFGSNFKNLYEPFSLPPMPHPLGGINEPDEILIHLTNTTEYEITALESLFSEISRLSLELNYSFLGENTLQHSQWFKANLEQLEVTNTTLTRKTRSKNLQSVDSLMKIPGLSATIIHHNKKIELLKKELGLYGNILICELSSFIDIRESSNNCRNTLRTS